jgi:hypothetical protein
MKNSIVILILFCLIGCSYKHPSSIKFFDSHSVERTLFARSKKAVDGEISLSHKTRFEYELDSPVDIPVNSSIAVYYTIPSKVSGEVHVKFDDDPPFSLPISIGGVTKPEYVFYAVPVNKNQVHTIVISSTGDKTTNGEKIQITNIMVTVPRFFGFKSDEKLLYLTPFINPIASSKQVAISINPPDEYSLKGKLNLQLKNVYNNSAFIAGGRRYEYISDVNNDIIIPHGLLEAYPISFEGRSDAVMLVPAAEFVFPYEPIPADPGIILSIPQELWRNKRFEVFSWDMFPSVLIFDTADYATQSSLFKRLAFFSEKKGYRGKIASDAEIEGEHDWNAHDYRPETLANFFNAVRKSNFQLSEDELLLEKILISNRIITTDNDGDYHAGAGAVISVSRETSNKNDVRMRLMNHEGFHGIFFVDEDFRNFAASRFENFDPKLKNFMRYVFDDMEYDVSDDFLMVNEFMAYCLQQAPPDAGKYFGGFSAAKIENGKWRKTLPHKDKITGIYPAIAEAFTAESYAFSDYVNKRWGLAAGRIWRIRPILYH